MERGQRDRSLAAYGSPALRQTSGASNPVFPHDVAVKNLHHDLVPLLPLLNMLFRQPKMRSSGPDRSCRSPCRSLPLGRRSSCGHWRPLDDCHAEGSSPVRASSHLFKKSIFKDSRRNPAGRSSIIESPSSASAPMEDPDSRSM